MRAALAVADIAGWPVLQMATAWIFTRLRIPQLPQNRSRSNALCRVSAGEARFYRSVLKINRWKTLLPDGAAWVGGSFKKKVLLRHDPTYLRQFAVETWRGELAHWTMLLLCPVFFLWNPPWADAVMCVYALAANGPCILAQRYNRYALLRIIRRSNRSSSDTP